MNSDILKQRVKRLQQDLADARQALRDELVAEMGITLGTTRVEVDGKLYLVTNAILEDSFSGAYLNFRGLRIKRDGTPGGVQCHIYTWNGPMKILESKKEGGNQYADTSAVAQG